MPGKQTKASQEAMEAYPEEIESESEDQEIPKEHAAVKPVGALKKRPRGWNPAAKHHDWPEERIQENCGSLKKLVAVRRVTTCHAEVAWCKGNIIGKSWTNDNVE
jgi:hypothetical protein